MGIVALKCHSGGTVPDKYTLFSTSSSCSRSSGNFSDSATRTFDVTDEVNTAAFMVFVNPVPVLTSTAWDFGLHGQDPVTLHNECCMVGIDSEVLSTI